MTKKRNSGLKARAETTTSQMEQDLQAVGLSPAPMTNENGELMAIPAPVPETPIIDALEASLLGETTEGDVAEGETTEGDVAEGETTEGAVAEGETTEVDVAEGAVAEGDVGEMSDEELLAFLAGKTDDEVDMTLGLASDELPVPDAAHAVGEEDTAAMDEASSPPKEPVVLTPEEAGRIFAAGGIDALSGRAFHPFITEDGVQVDDGVTGVSTEALPSLAPVRRSSRIAPITNKVVALLKEGKKSVPEMAKAVGVTEGEIRHAIDRARSQGEKILRLAPKVFGYQERPQPRRRLTASPPPASAHPAH